MGEDGDRDAIFDLESLNARIRAENEEKRGDFSLESFQNSLENRVARMLLNSYESAEYMFALDVMTFSLHKRHLRDNLILSLQARQFMDLPKTSQRNYLLGEVDYWDIAEYRKRMQSEEDQGRIKAQTQEQSEKSRCAERHYIGRRHGNSAVYITEQRNILTILANLLDLVRKFEEKERSISIKKLDYFSDLLTITQAGHLQRIVPFFEHFPPVYRSPSPSLAAYREAMEHMVRKTKPTTTYSPL